MAILFIILIFVGCGIYNFISDIVYPPLPPMENREKHLTKIMSMPDSKSVRKYYKELQRKQVKENGNKEIHR